MRQKSTIALGIQNRLEARLVQRLNQREYLGQRLEGVQTLELPQQHYRITPIFSYMGSLSKHEGQHSKCEDLQFVHQCRSTLALTNQVVLRNVYRKLSQSNISDTAETLTTSFSQKPRYHVDLVCPSSSISSLRRHTSAVQPHSPNSSPSPYLYPCQGADTLRDDTRHSSDTLSSLFPFFLPLQGFLICLY